MATSDQLVQTLYDYIAGNASAPSWLEQLRGTQYDRLWSMVNASRQALAQGVADPQQYLSAARANLNAVVNQVLPGDTALQYGFRPSTQPAPERPLPPSLPADANRPTNYLDPRNTIPNFVPPNSGATGVNTPYSQLTDAQKSAQAQINSTLSQFGLQNLGSNLWQQYLQGIPIEQIYLNMRQTPEYQARFPGMSALDKQGRSISEAQYIGLETSYRQVLQANGVPSDVIPDTPQTYASWITGNVSPTEVKDRATLAAQAAVSAPPETRSELQRLYGISAGDLTAYWLDPNKALPALQQRFAAAQLAGSAVRTGFGDLSQGQAEGVAQLGLSDAQINQGFNQLSTESELFSPLDAGENNISTDEQLGATFGGNATAQKAIQQRIAKRKAAFSGGGDFAGSAQGLSGLGTNATG